MWTARAVLLALVRTVLAVSLVAQDLPAPGARVRVWDDGGPIATGTFVRVGGDTIVLADPGGTMTTVTLQPGRSWGTSVGTSGHTLQGMFAGLLLGATAGAVIGYVTYEPPDCRNQVICLDYGPSFAGTVGLIAGGVSGLVGGGVLGWIVRSERWHPLGRLDPRLTLVPTGSQGAALALSVSF